MPFEYFSHHFSESAHEELSLGINSVISRIYRPFTLFSLFNRFFFLIYRYQFFSDIDFGAMSNRVKCDSIGHPWRDARAHSETFQIEYK